MPWASSDSEAHNKKADTPYLRRLWARVANQVLHQTGDEGRAIREANAAIDRATGRGKNFI